MIDKASIQMALKYGYLCAMFHQAGYPELAPTSDDSYQAYLADDIEFYNTYRELLLCLV